MSRDDFEEFLVDHLPWLEHLARSLAVQSDGDHHTLFSGTVTTLHRRWPTISPPVPEVRRAFATTVMLNLARTGRRRAHARCEDLADDLQDVLDRSLPAEQWADDPAFAIVRKESELEVYRAIRRLPETERAIMMILVQGFSWPEIAAMLGMGVKDVRSGVLRARRKLRELREGAGDDG
ncbi:RNA polymerase sigma factor [Actinomycetospora aeridis]|uniref:Sigma-70 family RNA polymerase sigma factor n=1 Tax=Actinomycetospora aeridis TaxID=3129231 RepID=A0ABU8N852_9PSEU